MGTRRAIKTKRVFDIFQPGLIRGEDTFAHKPDKKVFFVQHPTEGWRVFLRAVCFIHEEGHEEKGRFIVLKKSGADAAAPVWEAPKGQMEGKDALKSKGSILKLLEENVYREVEEESKVKKILALRHTGLVLQSQEGDYPKNHFFQYHVFQGFVPANVIQNALEEFKWLNEHPVAWARMRKDVREKDALAWFDPRHTHMMGRWSPTLVAMYLGKEQK
jgi:ADP-ribose pyrophosphatase YjhB (NUDIX family)